MKAKTTFSNGVVAGVLLTALVAWGTPAQACSINLFFEDVAQVSASYNPPSGDQSMTITGRDNLGNIIRLDIVGIDRAQDSNQDSILNLCNEYALLVLQDTNQKKPTPLALSVNAVGTDTPGGCTVDLQDPSHLLLQCDILTVLAP